jgi:DNA mismatch repair protein MutS2
MMYAADEQTLQDLEFTTIQEWLVEFAVGETARERLATLSPSPNKLETEKALLELAELKAIRDEGETFPRIEFEELTTEIRMLPIRNAAIQLEGFMRILQASNLVNSLLYFFDKREEEYPLLSALVGHSYFTKEIIEAIEKVFDKHGQVKDDASEKLASIRSSIRSLRKKINTNFDRAARKLMKENVLGETKETFINDRRVLTILSQHKRKIPGSVVGSSKTGSLTYIEPQVNIPLNNELEMLMDDERKEIFRILQELKKEIQVHFELIKSYQFVLTELDFINAKCRLAIDLDAQLPAIQEDRELELISAYHPILWKANRALKKKTHPQSVKMDKFSRMLVISGPNAGGKSITLKTVGLLQIMLQAGLLVPVQENSKMCFFNTILSDIGDNQSIANELSTYSYRLKRMKTFLDAANRNTLLLLDEFGTGSDPDLGGALAESIFESFYNRKCFGVITTHYANIKLKADRLKNAVNGCMLFNSETLEPTYRFSVGQPGSSFTFEVAEINGIPQEIIEDAKSKLDDKKVKMDRLLNDLQKEKTYLERLNKEHIEAQQNAQEALNEYEERKEDYEEKLKRIRTQADANNKLVALGKKMKTFIDRYNVKSRKKTINDKLLAEVKKYLAVERTKIDAAIQAKKEKERKDAHKPSAKRKKAKVERDQFQRHKIKVSSRVKLISTKQVGVVEEVSGENITVAFGFMRMKVDRNKLMWVED